MALCLLKIEKHINFDKANGLHKIGISRKVCLLPYAPPPCFLDVLLTHKTLATEAPFHELSEALGLKASSSEYAQHVAKQSQTPSLLYIFFSGDLHGSETLLASAHQIPESNAHGHFYESSIIDETICKRVRLFFIKPRGLAYCAV